MNLRQVHSNVNDRVTDHPAEYESVVVKDIYDLDGDEVFSFQSMSRIFQNDVG